VETLFVSLERVPLDRPHGYGVRDITAGPEHGEQHRDGDDDGAVAKRLRVVLARLEPGCR
jgi:hypothetical protein